MQASKIIDIKRSFVPVEPNSFPENYHTTAKEDNPTEPVPVVPYMGYNFLPTQYGYKSFFGTNQVLEADPIISKAEHVFLFQNMAYSNTLIALTDTGIYAKDSNIPGAWTQLVILVAPADGIYYEWFHTVISNKLYAFRSNGEAFYEIETDIADSLGIALNVKVPQFITINAQLGMFRLGSRLGFWDGTNAVAYSSPDDLTDFTPDAITGTNVTTFTSIVGKISNIRPHGRHCIVYASKSITLLQVEPADTFFVKAIPLIQAGVPYARQSVEAYPSSLHFCFSTTGIYKIDEGKVEAIVPEVFDYFRELTTQPVYLRLLNGRFLAFEILDENAVDGVPHFTNKYFPPAAYTFPGSTSVAGYSELNPGNINWCEFMGQLSAGNMDEIQADAAPATPGKKAGTSVEPVWACHLSKNGVIDPANIVWSSNPCGTTAHDGTQWDMSPNIPMLDDLTTDSSDKTTTTGEDAWTDGKWTMERFFQAQSAIWEMEEAASDAVLAAILDRTFSKTTSVDGVIACAASTPPYNYCDVGEFVSEFSAPQFGYNTCSFWLTRFAIETKKIQTKSRTVATCDTSANTEHPIAPDHYELWGGGSQVGGSNNDFASEAAAAAWYNNFVGNPVKPYEVRFYATPGSAAAGDYYETNGASDLRQDPYDSPGPELKAIYICDDPANRGLKRTDIGNQTPGWPQLVSFYDAGAATKITTSTASNVIADTRSGVLGVETAYCEIVGWKYTKEDGTTAIVPSSVCTNTNNAYPGSTPTETRTVNTAEEIPILVDSETGSICDLPFVAPLTPPGIEWPGQTLELEESSFLFQDGSIAPRWPTCYGALIYDLQLKKWGKFKIEYKQLLDYLPINSDSQVTIAGAKENILAGVLKESGYIYLFDSRPIESSLTWGKIGYYRQGFTDLQEITFNFAKLSTGTIDVDISVDGKNIVTEAAYSVPHEDARQQKVYPPYSGKWFNVTITGIFDISDLTVKGLVKGRR
jgi:hypothetical protein